MSTCGDTDVEVSIVILADGASGQDDNSGAGHIGQSSVVQEDGVGGRGHRYGLEELEPGNRATYRVEFGDLQGLVPHANLY